MDDSLRQAGNDAIAMVARDFDPVRIEQQLLARAFIWSARAVVSSDSPQDLL